MDETIFSRPSASSKSGSSKSGSSSGLTQTAPVTAPVFDKPDTAVLDRTVAAPLTDAPSNEADNWPEALFASLDVYPDNPGLGLAAPIFGLLSRARRAPQLQDMDWMHRTLVQSLQDFEVQLTARGVSSQHARLTLYALAASVDDAVLKTEWGYDSNWSSRTMISVFFHEAWGGERFFSLLQQMLSAPQALMRELEFFYFCLEFGFEGKYRLAANGPAELARLNERIYKVLYGIHGAPKPEISPVWRGVSVANRQLRDFLPVWIGALAVLVLLLFAYILLTATLSHETGLAREKVVALLAPPPPAPITVPLMPADLDDIEPEAPALAPIHTPVATPPAQIAPQPPQVSPFQQISGMLEPEQRAGVLRVLDQNGKVVIRTVGEVFASASTQVRDRFLSVLNNVGMALARTPGAVDVNGYTDSQPISTASFPNNIALSQARADAVAQMLRPLLGPDRALTSVGLGAADPLESNSTPGGRQANRRVEIVLTPKE